MDSIVQKPKEILELERIYQIQIERSPAHCRSIHRNSYILNKEGKIVKLNLTHNRITEIAGLDNLENLEIIDLSYNRITEIKGLDNLLNLKELNLSHNHLREIKGLDNLMNLERLCLSNNKFTINGLGHLVNLKRLNLSGNIGKQGELDACLLNGSRSLEEILKNL
jgi:protein phosphatase 1 regulatory subunit 7